ncbi:lymphocyte cytosolic protein 2-like isoform X3 [Argiope bruennichi]|uniref:lymphocyte cytosolic protein 2-like isoform X3 n=1 Tax=Argiope bruennichi TaxID=94029 RepID=UPI0024957C81|nr:lymphocyte cytosolic protein 2-like isoform X3 [Argiope bruennichi]
MAEKIILPHPLAVSRWKEEKVIKWLRKMHLEDCIPAFEIRHIDGPKLLELTEQKLFTYQDLKIKHRKQIAKCVQECKSQASNAKRIAKTLKHSQSSHSHTSESNGTCDSWDDSDDWGSDFEDEESDDEVKIEHSPSEVNNNSIIQSLPGVLEKPSNTSPVLTSNSSEEKSIPKPPDVPVISKVVNGVSNYKSNNTNSIPRPPLKRPPSQPPPPPVTQASSHIEPQEDYEIPIVPTSTNSKECFSFSGSFQNSLSGESAVIETYEIVEPPEENYEMVDPPPEIMNDKPSLPPRLVKSPNVISPPPLPQKPQKLKEISSTDGIRTFSRPKLPLKTENDAQVEVTQPSSLPSNVGFISSLIGRRSSTTPTSSPKIQHKNKDSANSFVTSPISTSVLNDSLSSTSSSPDRECSSTDGKKMQSLPPLPPRGVAPVSDDTGNSFLTIQNMATRPLPPVPVPKLDEKSSPYKQPQDIQQNPWFHEIEREDAEAAVRKLNEPGSFVVRPSKRAGKENPYSLTVLHEDKLFHLNIRLRPDNTFALGKEKEKEKTFATVADLITFHLNEPILLKNRGEAAGKTILRKYPEKT